jgi:hypothetical protein
MRLWHTTFAIFLFAMLLTISRGSAGRVAIVVFATGLAELICGVTAVMMLFQTVGSLGQSKGLLEGAQCVVATIVVTTVAAWMMVAMLTLGARMVERVV